MATRSAGQVNGKRLVEDLKPYLLQADVFDDLPETELAALAMSMRDTGLQHPIHVLPDGTVVSGHQRRLAAMRLGWKHIDVVIRHDLAAQGDSAIRAFFIEENLRRRQLGPCGIARCYRAEQAAAKSKGRHYSSDRQDLRDRLGKRFHLSGRQLDRYAKLLDLPRPIQSAVDDGRLPVATAGLFLKLPEPKQQEAATAMASGEDPKKVAKRYVGTTERPTLPTSALLNEIANCMEEQIARLVDRTDAKVTTDEQRRALQRVRAFADRLLDGSKPSKTKKSGQNVQT